MGADGIGYYLADCLRSEGFKFEFVRVGQRVEPGRGGPDDPSLRFFNLRAQYYQRIADLLERNMLDGYAMKPPSANSQESGAN